MNSLEGTNFNDFKRELLRDEKTREEYERLKPKYELIQALIKRRNELRISQDRLARIIGTRQPAISRLEKGEFNTTLGMLFKVTNALGLDISLKAKSKTRGTYNKIPA
jgi:DNA-binding XRE family transcriptional regulator